MFELTYLIKVITILYLFGRLQTEETRCDAI